MKEVTIYIMGKQYKVPANITIMKAMEYCGYMLIRGCGCRSSFCGACGTFFRVPNDYRIKVGLACSTLVQDGMHIVQLPFFPANKAIYNIEKLEPTAETIIKLYPEITRCLSCNTCSKACPQELKVMDFVQAALKGDIAKAADLSFDCIMCGLCASRCPAEIIPYYIAILCRRLYGKYILKKANHLQERIKEIAEGKFDKEIESLTKVDKATLEKMYAEREIEE